MEPTEVRGGGEFSRSLIMVGGRGVCPRQSASLDRASNSKTPGESSQGGAYGGWGGLHLLCPPSLNKYGHLPPGP